MPPLVVVVFFSLRKEKKCKKTGRLVIQRVSKQVVQLVNLHGENANLIEANLRKVHIQS